MLQTLFSTYFCRKMKFLEERLSAKIIHTINERMSRDNGIRIAEILFQVNVPPLLLINFSFPSSIAQGLLELLLASAFNNDTNTEKRFYAHLDNQLSNGWKFKGSLFPLRYQSSLDIDSFTSRSWSGKVSFHKITPRSLSSFQFQCGTLNRFFKSRLGISRLLCVW